MEERGTLLHRGVKKEIFENIIQGKKKGGSTVGL